MSKGANIGRYMRWEGNIPVPCYAEPVTTEEMTNIGKLALAQPYVPQPDILGNISEFEESFRGMSCLEVAYIRLAQRFAGGDIEAGKMIYDRTIGKPKQHVEQVTMTGTLHDFLDQIRVMEEENPTVFIEVQADPEIDYIGIKKKETIEEELGL